MFHQKALDSTDLNRPVSAFGSIQRFKHSAAFFFAKPRRRAKYAAGASHYIIFFNRSYGTGDIFKSQLADKFSRPGIGRTPLGAGGVVAKQAAVRFGNGLGQIKPFAHFLKFI
jgi:hypothetical protein